MTGKNIKSILSNLVSQARAGDQESAVLLVYLWRARNDWQSQKSPRLLADFFFGLREARAWSAWSRHRAR